MKKWDKKWFVLYSYPTFFIEEENYGSQNRIKWKENAFLFYSGFTENTFSSY